MISTIRYPQGSAAPRGWVGGGHAQPRFDVRHEPWRTLLHTAQLLCTVSIAIGISALAGYVSGTQRLYDWSEISVPIAIPTAIAISAQGLALFATIEFLKRRHGRRDC